MSKHIKKFPNETAYNTFKRTMQFKTPCLSYCVEEDKVMWDRYISEAFAFMASRKKGAESPVFTGDTNNVFTGSTADLYKTLSHFKIGTFKNGVLTHELKPCRLTEDIDGNEVKIDGTDGDVLLYVDAPIFYFRHEVEAGGEAYNALGLGLNTFSYSGYTTKEFQPFAFTPQYTVNVKLNDDSEVCAHSIYNENVEGSYVEPIAPAILSRYKNDGYGYPSTQSAMETFYYASKKGKGYMGLYYEFYEIWLTAMFLELGTLLYFDESKFGTGFGSYAPGHISSSFFYSSVGDTYTYDLWISSGYEESDHTIWDNMSKYIEREENFIEMLEAQRAVDALFKANLQNTISGGTSVYTYDISGNMINVTESVDLHNGNGMVETKKYFTFKNVNGCQSLNEMVMTCIVEIFVKLTISEKTFSYYFSFWGDEPCVFKFSLPLYRGLNLNMFPIPMEGINIVKRDSGYNNSYVQFYYVDDWRKISHTFDIVNPDSCLKLTGATFDEISGITPSFVNGYSFGGEVKITNNDFEGLIENGDYEKTLCYGPFVEQRNDDETICECAWLYGTFEEKNFDYQKNVHFFFKDESIGSYISRGSFIAPNTLLYTTFYGGFSHPAIRF